MKINCNAKRSERSARVTFQHTGIWYDYFANDSLIINSVRRDISLLPGQYHIYTDKQIADSLFVHLDDGAAPMSATFVLHQNYPNPFNPATMISFEVPVGTDLALEIYNTQGEKIRTLASCYQPAGHHTLQWDGRNDAGQFVASGVYFCRLKTASWLSTVKMLLVH